MAQKREEFKKFLEEAGVLKELTEGLEELQRRKNEECTAQDALEFLHHNFGEKNKNELQQVLKTMMQELKEQMKIDLDEMRAEMKAEIANTSNAMKFTYWLLGSQYNSSLITQLTEAINNHLNGQTTKLGATLIDYMTSIAENPDLPMGIYAADADTYNKFEELFNTSVKDHHGFTNGKVHPSSDWGDDSKLSQFADLDPSKEYIISTRIDCIRSVKNYKMNFYMTDQDYLALLKKVKDDIVPELNSDADLQGELYELECIDGGMKQKFKNHPLSKDGCDYIQAAEDKRFGLEGRAIFRNNTNTFSMWINGEDHLRFISMEDGGEIRKVYNRLKTAVLKCSSKMEFMEHKKFGWLTCCPTNLGTIQSSVIIKVPKLVSKLPDLQHLAKKLNLQIDDIDDVGGTCKISNKRSLEATEFSVFKEMYYGVAEIIQEEEQQQINEFLNHPACNQSLKGYLKPNVLKALTGIKTTGGMTLLDCFKSGKNHNSVIGIYAADNEAYVTFEDLFNKIIEDHHGFSGKTHPSSNWGDEKKFPDLGSPVVKSTRIECVRSVNEMKSIMTEQDCLDLLTRVEDILSNLDDDLKGTLFKLKDLDPTQKTTMESELLFKDGVKYLEEAEAKGFRSEGSAVFMSNTNTFSVWIIAEHHLRFISMQDSGDIENIYKLLINAVDKYKNEMAFLEHKKFGWLTLCPTTSGKTFQLSVTIEVPNIAAKQIDVRFFVDQFQLQTLELDSAAGKYEISSKQSLGLTEEAVVQQMYDGIKEIIKRENQAAVC